LLKVGKRNGADAGDDIDGSGRGRRRLARLRRGGQKQIENNKAMTMIGMRMVCSSLIGG
jgi:hypothetical protein